MLDLHFFRLTFFLFQSFPAKNLLCSESYKKWKSKSPGEKAVSVLLKFENSSQIEAVHIGNEGSAFVEILVGKLGEDVRDFQVRNSSYYFSVLTVLLEVHLPVIQGASRYLLHHHPGFSHWLLSCVHHV